MVFRLNLADVLTLHLYSVFNILNFRLQLFVFDLLLGVELFLVIQQVLLCLNLCSQILSIGFKFVLFIILLLGLSLCVVDLARNTSDVVTLFYDVGFILVLLFFELFIFNSHVFKTFVLLFLCFLEIFELTHELAKNLVFFKLAALLLEAFETIDLYLDILDDLSLLLLLFLLIGNFFIAFLHVRLQLGDLLYLVVCHSKSCSVVTGLVKDLTDKLFALLDEFLLSFVTGFQRLINLLIFLFELLQVLALQVVVQKLSELILDGLVLFLIETKAFNFLGLFLSLVVSFDVSLAIINLILHVCHNSN